jgi:uncharacterized membrane protein
MGDLATASTEPPRRIRFGPRAWQLARRELRSPYVWALLASVAAYSSYWSWLSVTRYDAMVSAVYDLGVFAQHTWMFTQPGTIGRYALPSLSGPLTYLGLVADEPFEFLLSPLALLNSYPTVLVLQSVALGAGALPLYAIARRILTTELPALCVALAYLLYFPLGGVNWFDVHFIAFFIPLFFLGYYFLLRRSFLVAGVLLFLAGTTEYPSVLLVILFALTLLVEALLNGRFLKRGWDRPALRFSAVLFVVSLVFFAYQFVYLNSYLGTEGFAVTVHTASTGGVAIASGPISLHNRLMVAFLILTPVLFLPLLSPRWLVMLTPIGYLVFATTYFGYSFPSIFRDQYGATFIPFIFLGVVYSIQWLRRFVPVTARPPFARRARPWSSVGRLAHPSVTGLAVLVTVVVFASIFQPYGPFNGVMGDKFTVPPVDMTRFDQLAQLESLVPRGTPYVLFQNDMPGMLPRPLAYLDTPLVSGIGDWQNVSVYDADVGEFPLTLFTGATVLAAVNYAIDDPYNWGFTELGDTPNNSMYHFARALYGSGMYGILGEVDGMVVLERGYSGSPVQYLPFTQWIPASDLTTPAPPTARGNNTTSEAPPALPGPGLLSVTDLDAPRAWNGPDLTLSPGWYEAQFSMMTTNPSADNHITLRATGDHGVGTSGERTITGANFTAGDTWTSFNLTFYVNNTEQSVDLLGASVFWQGTLSLQWIDLLQESAGTPRYSAAGASI